MQFSSMTAQQQFIGHICSLFHMQITSTKPDAAQLVVLSDTAASVMAGAPGTLCAEMLLHILVVGACYLPIIVY